MKNFKNENFENTKKAFQKFYEEELTENDAREIYENLTGLLKIFNESKRNKNKD